MEDELERIKREMLRRMTSARRSEERIDCPFDHAADASSLASSLRSCKVVIADFWAEWCGPCRITSPIVDAIARKYEGRVAVLKVNVDENPDLALEYGVMSLPTIIVFHQGREVERFVGYSPALPRQLDQLVSALLSS